MINAKWIENIKARPEIVKFLEENLGKMLLDFGLDNDLKFTENKSKNR